jgi:hypothetical protein
VKQICGLQVKTRSESWSFDLGGNVAKDWPVWEFGVRENWKCASLKTPEAPKPKEPK